MRNVRRVVAPWPKAGRGRGISLPPAESAAMVAFQIAHREQRMTQILTTLAAGPADAGGLARSSYTNIDPVLLPAARRNVLATLIGLLDEGRVATRGPLSEMAVFELV